ncbi:MAG: hypothetical protein RBT63_09395, partial [Bdellovibrionales bacterium]|nr:hypothetical protein [Bdellovibrionales bacterium]
REVAILSREAEALKKGFEGYGETVEQLREKNRVLSNQVLPSLKTELQSGKEPPYDFFCTMVRTDINNFTQIFHSYPVDVFLGYINRFFNECSHVVSRYDGLIHEFVGDEIIYYFKDEDHSNSFTAALACAAEVAEVARRIHEQTSKTDGYDFRVKSSLSYGQIRFGPMLNGFSLAGAPLIETTRILSAVNDKSENTIHFDSSQTERLYAGVRFEEGFKASLKGMPGERVILRYLGHEPVESVMKQATLPDAIQDYRSDHELTQMLLYVRDELAQPSGPNPFVFSVVRALSRVKVTTCGANLARALHETVRGLLHAPHKEFAEESVREMDRVLATLAISLPKLLPNEWIDGDTENLLIDLIEYRDDRVVANTIESMQALRDRGFDLRKIDRQLMSSRNTRVAANSTVFVGTDEISKDVVRKVESMLADENPIVVTAGLFAWGEIARHHLQEDPVYYRTQVRFQRLSEKFARVLERYPELEAAVQQAMRKANMNLEKASGAAGQAA